MKLKKFWAAFLGTVLALPIIFGFTACTPEKTPPDEGDKSQPTALAAPVISLDERNITWAAVEHADGYEIFENDVSIATTGGTLYYISQQTAGTYTYAVKATSTDSNYTSSPMSNTVSYTVEEQVDTSIEYEIYVDIPDDYEGADLQVGLYSEGTLVKSAYATFDSAQGYTLAKIKVQAGRYVAKISSLPEGYVTTQAVVTDSVLRGNVAILHEDGNQLNLGTNTITVSSSENNVPISYYFKASTGGVYTIKTSERKNIRIDRIGGGDDALIDIQDGKNLSVFNTEKDEIVGLVVLCSFEGSQDMEYSVEIQEGEAEQYLVTSEDFGGDNGNTINGSCNRYLNLDKDTTYTVAFTGPTMGMAKITFTIDGTEYVFSAEDGSLRQDITFKAGKTRIEITVEGEAAFGYFAFYIYPPREFLSVSDAAGAGAGNTIEGSCNKYLNVTEETTYTFEFIEATIGSAQVTLRINDTNYVFSKTDLRKDILLYTGENKVEITVEGATSGLTLYIYPAAV